VPEGLEKAANPMRKGGSYESGGCARAALSFLILGFKKALLPNEDTKSAL
jgi:hypothetical protein